MPTTPTEIEVMVDRITGFERDDVRRLARAAERHHLDTRLPFGSLQRDVLAFAEVDHPGTGETLKAAQAALRQAMAARLREFPELRSDHTYKTAVQSALKRAAFALVAREHLAEGAYNRLLAPWREAISDPSFAR
ncbi:MAG: hypothetical protein ACR2K4_03735 [Candidatus Limnocylindria bacterium]